MNWFQENPVVAAAIIAAISAVLGGLIAAGARFLFDIYLSERFKRRLQSVETKRKYSSPIIHAADDLAARIENLNRFLPKRLATEWLEPISENEVSRIPFDGYYYISSVFTLARLIAWIEILRREQIFLDFSSIRETQQFSAYLSLIYAALSAPDFTSGKQDRSPKDHWIYYHYLPGIAEAVIKRDQNGGLRCSTLHEFCADYRQGSNSDFRLWINEIERMFVNLSSEPDDLRWRRFQILWFCLDCFLEFVDPKRIRTTRDRTRSKQISSELKTIAIKRANQLDLELRQA